MYISPLFQKMMAYAERLNPKGIFILSAKSYAIVNAGGFLGLATHNVAIPVSQFKLVDKELVLPGATKEALKASPEFQYAE